MPSPAATVESFSTIQAALFPESRHDPQTPAILATGRKPLLHGQLRSALETSTAELRRLGIGLTDRVAVVLPNGPEMAMSFLAVTAIAACAPLNPGYHEQELDFYLSDLKATAVLVPEGGCEAARASARRANLPILELTPSTHEPAGIFQLRGEKRQPIASSPPSPESVALLLHTSGTTSRPKLVPLTQANLCASAANIGRTLDLSPQDRCLNVMPLFHIHGLIAALLSSLARGAGVICTGGFEATGFFSALDLLQPTWYTAVPTIHQAVLAAAGEHAQAVESHRLRLVRSSSSALPPAVMRKLEETFGVPVVEAYGMTEASHQMCSNPLPPRERRPGSVGLPAGPDVAVMSADGSLLSAGQRGEVVIRGRNVTLGYESNPEANRAAFTNGWFRTGDEGYFDENGYLFLVGRLKEIINRGAEKVAPREIDEVLLEHPDVAQAVAFAVPHPTLGEDIAAAVVLRPNAEATAAEIRDLAYQRLAGHKVPSRVIIVDAIPKGPTNKIQRVGLAAKLADRLTTPYQPPRDEIEALVADLWRETVGATTVGRLDNFFAIGGDSLRATRVMARVNEIFGLELAVVAAFRHPTLDEFCEHVRQAAPPQRLQTIIQSLRELQQMSDEEAGQLLAAPRDREPKENF